MRHTERGTDILRNFVFHVCGALPYWSGASFITETVESIRKQVGDQSAICALSGGVDSAVAAALVHRAIGDRLTNIFVDNGLLRKNEFRETIELLESASACVSSAWMLPPAFWTASPASPILKPSASASARNSFASSPTRLAMLGPDGPLSGAGDALS